MTSGVAPAAGTGPTLVIDAGNTIAFSASNRYLLINRGSRIMAEGTSLAPITFTGFTDAVSNTAGPYDVQLWGGIVINGNGITNNCTDAQRASDACHVQTEGRPSQYGGNNNAESSGSLKFVVVKHTGFELAPGDELNGVTFNAVGSGRLSRTSRSTAPMTMASSFSAAPSISRTSSRCLSATTRSTSRTATAERSRTRS